MWSVLTVVYIGQQQKNQVVKCACNESQKSTQETRYHIFILCILFVCRPGGVQSWHRAVAFADRTRTILEQVAVLHLLFSRRKKTQKKTSSRFGWPFPATLFTRRCQSSSISVVWGSSAAGRSKTDHLLGKNVGSTQTSLILNVPSAASSLEQMLTEQILPWTNAH